MSDLWDNATRDFTDERVAALHTAARVATVDVWSHVLATAQTRSDFENRLAVIGESLDQVCSQLTEDPGLFITLRAKLNDSFIEDFEHLSNMRQAEQQRVNAPRAYERNQRRHAEKTCPQCEGEGEVPFMAGSYKTCETCMGSGKVSDDTTASRKLAGDSGRRFWYFVMPDGTKKGPFDDEGKKDLAAPSDGTWRELTPEEREDFGAKAAARTAYNKDEWWPVTPPPNPDSAHPDETALRCPKCNAPHVIISGNNLGSDIVRNNIYTTLTCAECGYKQTLYGNREGSRLAADDATTCKNCGQRIKPAGDEPGSGAGYVHSDGSAACDESMKTEAEPKTGSRRTADKQYLTGGSGPEVDKNAYPYQVGSWAFSTLDEAVADAVGAINGPPHAGQTFTDTIEVWDRREGGFSVACTVDANGIVSQGSRRTAAATRVIDSGQAGYAPGKFQAQYQQDGTWFDIGDPVDTREAAQAKCDSYGKQAAVNYVFARLSAKNQAQFRAMDPKRRTAIALRLVADWGTSDHMREIGREDALAGRPKDPQANHPAYDAAYEVWKDKGEKKQARMKRRQHRHAAVAPEALNNLVEFDSPFEVTEDGDVTDPPGVYAPSVYFDSDEDGQMIGEPEIDGSGWDFVTGYSRQDRYSGPVMHPSEQLGGGMARDVLAEPGVYCITSVEDMNDPENPAGWVLLKKTGARRTAAGEGPWYCKTCNGQIAGGEETGWHHIGPAEQGHGSAADADHKPEPGGAGTGGPKNSALKVSWSEGWMRGFNAGRLAAQNGMRSLAGFKSTGDEAEGFRLGVQAFNRMGEFRKGAPFAGYDDFDACVKANSDKDDPEAYCGRIKHEVEGARIVAGTTYCKVCNRQATRSRWSGSYCEEHDPGDDNPNRKKESSRTAERDRATNPQFGDQTACKNCDMDIEYHGPDGWIDRGGNSYCDESGAAKWDQDGVPVPLPHTKHQPYSDRVAAYNPLRDPEHPYNKPDKGPHNGTPTWEDGTTGIPASGDLTPEQQAWMDKGRKKKSMQRTADDDGVSSGYTRLSIPTQLRQAGHTVESTTGADGRIEYIIDGESMDLKTAADRFLGGWDNAFGAGPTAALHTTCSLCASSPHDRTCALWEPPPFRSEANMPGDNVVYKLKGINIERTFYVDPGLDPATEIARVWSASTSGLNVKPEDVEIIQDNRKQSKRTIALNLDDQVVFTDDAPGGNAGKRGTVESIGADGMVEVSVPTDDGDHTMVTVHEKALRTARRRSMAGRRTANDPFGADNPFMPNNNPMMPGGAGAAPPAGGAGGAPQSRFEQGQPHDDGNAQAQPVMPGGSPQKVQEQPPASSQFNAKVNEIYAGIVASNPSLDLVTALKLASETIQRFPSMVKRAASDWRQDGDQWFKEVGTWKAMAQPMSGRSGVFMYAITNPDGRTFGEWEGLDSIDAAKAAADAKLSLHGATGARKVAAEPGRYVKGGGSASYIIVNEDGSGTYYGGTGHADLDPATVESNLSQTTQGGAPRWVRVEGTRKHAEDIVSTIREVLSKDDDFGYAVPSDLVGKLTDDQVKDVWQRLQYGEIEPVYWDSGMGRQHAVRMKAHDLVTNLLIGQQMGGR